MSQFGVIWCIWIAVLCNRIWFLAAEDSDEHEVLDVFISMFTPKSEFVQRSECRELGLAYYNGIKRRQAWALEMLDSSSKLPSGILSGNIADLGQMDQCLSVQTVINNTTLHGKYCLVQFTSLSQMRKDKEYNENFAKNRSDSVYFLKINNSTKRIFWSICVPDACTTTDVYNHLHQSLAKYMSNYLETPVDAIVREDDCKTQDTLPKWRTFDWTILIISIVYVIHIALQTCYDMYLNHYNLDSWHPLLTSFSILSNGRQLFEKNKDKKRYKFIDGIRTISIVWIIFGHRLMFINMSFSVNSKELQSYLHVLPYYTLFMFYMSVNYFFVISGFVMTKGFLNDRASGKPYNLLMAYIHRYVRLTPALIAMLLFTVTFFRLVSSGPLWAWLPSLEINNCEKYWWSLLLYVQNYVNPGDLCLAHTWYLSTDMQLFLLSQLLVIPLYRWRKFAIHIIIILIAVISLTAAGVSVHYNLHIGLTSWDWNYVEAYHFSTYCRAGPYLIGMVLAFVIYEKRDVGIVLSPRIRILGWTCCICSNILLITVQYWSNQSYYTPSIAIETMHNSLQHVLWSLCIAWIILACSSGYSGWINSLLSIRLFEIVSKLTYSMYVVHLIILETRVSSVRTVQYISIMDIIYECTGDMLCILLLAVIWTLLFEIPFRHIDSICFNANGPCKRKKSVDNSSKLPQ